MSESITVRAPAPTGRRVRCLRDARFQRISLDHGRVRAIPVPPPDVHLDQAPRKGAGFTIPRLRSIIYEREFHPVKLDANNEGQARTALWRSLLLSIRRRSMKGRDRRRGLY